MSSDEMRCTFCGYYEAWWRPKDLDDWRRACGWCLLKLGETNNWKMVVEPINGEDWEEVQEDGEGPLGTVSSTPGRVTPRRVPMGEEVT